MTHVVVEWSNLTAGEIGARIEIDIALEFIELSWLLCERITVLYNLYAVSIEDVILLGIDSLQTLELDFWYTVDELRVLCDDF